MMTSENSIVKPVEVIDGVPIYGDALEALGESLAWTFPLSQGRNQEDKNWGTKEVAFHQFLGRLFDHKESKKKNGECFLQGALVKGVKQRTIPNVKELHFVILDIDSGQPLEEVRNELINRDLTAILYTTYSNGTTRTQIKKTELIQKLKVEPGEDITTAHVKFYLEHHKRMDKRIRDTCVFVGEDHVEGGVMLFVDHAPMQKYRIVLPLKESFVLAHQAGGDERAARDLWKRKYVGVAHMLGASYDRACTDISRLFFWPTHAPGATDYRVEMVVGDFLDLEEIEGKDAKDLEAANPFTEAGIDQGDRRPLDNPWLASWMKGKYELFCAADFFQACYDDRGRNGEKQTTECPFDGGHSNAGDVNDKGFFCADGNGEDSFTARCSHDSCSQYWKLDYVDKAITDLGLDEDFLAQFVPEIVPEKVASDEPEDDGVDVTQLSGEELITYQIGRLKPGAFDDADKVFALIVDAQLDNTRAVAYLRSLAKNAGLTFSELRKKYDRQVSAKNKEHADRKAEEEGVVQFPVNGDYNAQIEAAVRGIKKKNHPPMVFHAEDDIVLLEPDSEKGGLKRSLLSLDNFKVFVEDSIHFYKQSDQGRQIAEAPMGVVKHIYNMPRTRLPLPQLKGVAKHPILSVDGAFAVKPGYDKFTSIYLATHGMKLIPAPKAPTEDELDEAWNWFFAAEGAFGDFPFKDDGDDEKAAEDPGHLNGESTRAHALALLLLPLVRQVINAPAPAFVINKPMPGAGSGLFANVFNLVINNDVCPTHAPPKNTQSSEEFDKLILGKLLSDPDTPMFFDNVERIESNSLASAITSGMWSGRTLGSSKVVTLPVRHVWLFSGNNIDPSDELARRMIPINIMPEVARPELRTDFFHKDLVGWVKKHRPELLWALQVFVNNWVAKGMPDYSGATLGSFEDWSRVTGGILECAGVGGFLSNLASWRNLSTTSNQDDNDVMAGLLAEVGMGKDFRTGELFDTIYDDTSGKLDVDVPLRGRDRHSLKSSFGKYMGFRKGKVYEIEGKQIQLRATGMRGGVVMYRFEEVGRQAKAA
jgi:hypothetical protein